jgi:hypothetical protein
LRRTYPKPDDDRHLLLDELIAYPHQKTGFFSKNLLSELLIKVRNLVNPAALPYLLLLVHSANAEVRRKSELTV